MHAWDSDSYRCICLQFTVLTDHLLIIKWWFCQLTPKVDSPQFAVTATAAHLQHYQVDPVQPFGLSGLKRGFAIHGLNAIVQGSFSLTTIGHKGEYV